MASYRDMKYIRNEFLFVLVFGTNCMMCICDNMVQDVEAGLVGVANRYIFHSLFQHDFYKHQNLNLMKKHFFHQNMIDRLVHHCIETIHMPVQLNYFLRVFEQYFRPADG